MSLRGKWLRPPLLERFKAFAVPHESGCWIWIGNCMINSSGNRYGRIWMSGRNVKASHAALHLFRNEPLPLRGMALHSCDNTLCVNPDHLRVGSHRDNMTDRGVRRRTARGESNHGGRKLSRTQASALRCLRASGHWQYRDLAKLFRVAHSTAHRICRGLLWR